MEKEMSQRESRNAELSRQVAAQGMVLLQNNNQVLPIKNKSVALYGSGAFATYKGGTGSGDVNQRSVINIESGLLKKGFKITSQGWLNRFKRAFHKSRDEYYDQYKDSELSVLAPAFAMDDPEVSDFSPAKTGIYVISRSAGEGQDRENKPGDYQLTDNELSNIQAMSQFYQDSVVLLNVGGVIDTSFIEQCPLLDSVLLVSQPGMDAGLAIADVLDGSVTPMGKLTDTWAKEYRDYYSANSFGQQDPHYQEGIYVGYRYFDSFNIKPRYEFGYGMSYTKFFIEVPKIHVDEQSIQLKIKVQNIGEDYHGSEVVQLYVSNPQSDIPTPYQSLQGYVKTKDLRPDEEQELEMSIPVKNLASFDESRAAEVLVPGIYIIRVGNSSKKTQVVGEFRLDEEVIVKQYKHKLVPENDPTVLRSNNVKIVQADKVPFFILKAVNFDEPTIVNYQDKNIVHTISDHEDGLPGNGREEIVDQVEKLPSSTLIDVYNKKVSLQQFVAQLPQKELIKLVEGILQPEQMGSIVGNAAQDVPGAAGQTYSNDTYKIPATVNADGPAGLRLTPKYQDDDGNTQVQYATAWPIGTLLAQTWDVDLIKQVGKAVGEEMKVFGVTIWLAPGMNIHRDPLGGRNFEYYSEDPVLSGTIAAAEVNGVQLNPGVGATIKHFLGNNQETKRNTGDSIIGEQALREIYLKNFKIAVETSQPMAVMSSYNKVNGTFAGQNFDSLTNILRDEWHFKGLVMTDWFSLADPVEGLHAGNDLVMPGANQDKVEAGISNLAPEFDENGVIKSRRVFDIASMSVKTKELWNDFVPDQSGEAVVAINLGKSQQLDDSIAEMIFAGTAQIVNDHKVLISGHWKDNNKLYLGDLQKSAFNILKVVMKTDRFASLVDQAATPLNDPESLKSYFQIK